VSIRLIVFDLDGTLVDSRRDIADAANALLESCGAARLPEDRIGRMVGDGAATLVARAFEASGIELPRDALDRYLVLYEQRWVANTKPYPGMIDTLEALMPRARLAVLTNKPRRATLAILGDLDLARFFPDQLVVGGDGPFPRKPDPAGLRSLQDKTSCNGTSTLFVGDSVIDFRTARAAHTPICVARYGFGFSTFESSAGECDDRLGHVGMLSDVCLIDSPRQLLDLL